MFGNTMVPPAQLHKWILPLDGIGVCVCVGCANSFSKLDLHVIADMWGIQMLACVKIMLCSEIYQLKYHWLKPILAASYG